MSDKLRPLDFVKDISENKKDILDEENEKYYKPWTINRYLSMHPTTVMFANEMNLRPMLSKRMQYDYYMQAIRKERRFFKYAKEEEIDNIEMVKEYFGYGKNKAKDVMKLLSDEDIAYIKQRLYKGGHNVRQKKE
jgi:Bacteriophage clamp loader A subunit